MFTPDNTLDAYSNRLLKQMNAALTTLLDGAPAEFREDFERTYADRIMPVAEEGMGAADILALVQQ